MKLWFFLVSVSSSCFAAAFEVAGRGCVPRYRNLHSTRHRHRHLLRAAPEDSSGTELISALARIDDTWRIQQRYGPQQSRWKEIIVEDETVYLLEPPSSTIPSCLIVFYGGAGLGQFPHIAYNELLVRISNRLNAAFVVAPYSISLDHFTLAKKAGELARKAVIQCEDDRQYPNSLKTYCLAHSLGCKLATIYIAATDQEYEGIGFISFNNFGFKRTISMAREFGGAIGEASGNTPSRRQEKPGEILDQIFDFAESAMDLIGIEFTPSPAEMNRLIELKFDSERQMRTRMFAFDNDTLETTEEFLQACSGEGPSVSGLEGTHLTPVYFKVDLDEVDSMPPEAREMAREAIGGFRSFSFGIEEELNALVNEICNWILGKGPSRPPKWQQELPQIAAAPGSCSEYEH